MSKILDLSVFKEETLDITMPKGNVINISKPTKRMAIEVLKLQDINEESSKEEVINAMDVLALEILNSNINHVVFTEEDIEEMSYPMKMAIVNAYTEFLVGIQNNPN